MRALILLAALAATGCFNEQAEPPTGVLWERRVVLADALRFRHGQLAATSRKKALPCVDYWISGDGSDAQTPLETCELNRRQVRAEFALFLSVPVTDADVADARLWRYLAEHSGL